MKRNVIKLTESDLHKVIKKSVNKVLSEDVKGRFMSYNPSASGFDEDFDDSSATSSNDLEFQSLMENALNSISSVREHARKSGYWDWYTLLNSVISEIHDRLNN
jgi:hypothetical protein